MGNLKMILDKRDRDWILPVSISLFICGLILIVFDSYYDVYEGLFASFVAGLYTNPIKDYDIDMHFLLLPLYSKINACYSDYFVYGGILFSITVASIIYFTFILNKWLIYFDINHKTCILLSAACMLSIDMLIYVGSTKAAFILIFSLLAHAVLRDIKRQHENNTFYIIFMGLFMFCGLVRLDAIVFSSLVFFCFGFIRKRIQVENYLSILIGSIIFLLHKYLLSSDSEAKQVFFYKEYEIVDRSTFGNFNFQEIEILDIRAYREFLFTDIEHFTFAFYDKILTSSVGKLGYLLNISIKSFKSTIQISAVDFRDSQEVIFLCFIALVIILLNKSFLPSRWKVFLILLFFLPIVMNVFLVTPSRFLIPYYFALSTICLVLAFRFLASHYIFLLNFGFVALFLIKGFRLNELKKSEDTTYKKNIEQISELNNENGVIAISALRTMEFFPVRIFEKKPNINAVFVNMFLFNSYQAYLDRWQGMCNCNPLSLKDKISFLIDKKIPIVESKGSMDFYKIYFEKKYKVDIHYSFVKKFNNDLDVYKVSFEK